MVRLRTERIAKDIRILSINAGVLTVFSLIPIILDKVTPNPIFQEGLYTAPLIHKVVVYAFTGGLITGVVAAPIFWIFWRYTEPESEGKNGDME